MNESEFLKSLLNDMYDGVYFVDKDRKITFWNKAAERITGFSGSEVLGHSCQDNVLIHIDEEGVNLCEAGCPIQKTLEDGQPREAEIFVHHKDGYRVPVLVRVSPVRDDSGHIVGGVEIFGDNSPRQEARQRIRDLEKLAMLDELTGLPNRRYMDALLSSRLEEFKRLGWPLGVLFLDIDHFKQVNDEFGHDAGDEVLKMISRTMELSSRPYDVVGRWGGEEFLAIIPHVDIEGLHVVAERYRKLVKESIIFRDPVPLRVTISIGGVTAGGGDTPETLVKRADENLYTSKCGGRDAVTCTV